MTEQKSAEQLAGEIKADFDRRFDEVKGIATDAIGKAERGEPLTAEAKARADEAITLANEAKARLDEVEQKMARRGTEERDAQKSPGQLLTEDAAVKSFMDNPTAGKRIGIETKAIISALTTDANGSAGDLIVPQRVGMVEPVTRRMTVRDLLTPGRTSANAIQYPLETGFTNSAATVSETTGATKPQSEIKFDIRTTSVTTIAHWLLATRQILDDVPMLQSYVDGRLRYGLAYVEENQLLNGGGTGTDLNGIYTQATAFAAGSAVVASPTRIDVLRYAMLQAVLAELPPTGHVLNPTDWALIETTKDAAGGYIIGNPQGSLSPTLWGLPVVATQAMAAGSFLTGAFRMGAQIFDRMDARVEISTEDSDNFRKNLVTILAEERLALAVYRPEAFIKGTFAAAITDLTS
ncbi:phage major capsid protein [Sphingomonas sp.]|uniref:phage major capsid protein n=1 Tax=Sphingomonas sp. TaxID=28214 RepID=UPI003B3B1215